jgi:hypothetical protein
MCGKDRVRSLAVARGPAHWSRYGRAYPARQCARPAAWSVGREQRKRLADGYQPRRLPAPRSRSGRPHHEHAGRFPHRSDRNSPAGRGIFLRPAADQRWLQLPPTMPQPAQESAPPTLSGRSEGTSGGAAASETPTKVVQVIIGRCASRDLSAARWSLPARNRTDFRPELQKCRSTEEDGFCRHPYYNTSIATALHTQHATLVNSQSLRKLLEV